jgi:hypothetical protein
MFAVREPGQRLGLAPEHPEVLVVDEVPAAHDLEGDSPVRVLLLGLEDDPHPALAELAEDAEAEVYESRPLTRELEAPAVVGNQPDGRGRKETAELDGDALKLTILEPRAWIRHGENRLERPSLKLLGGVSAALGCCCFDNAERSCVRVAGRLGQEDLPGREDEVSDRAAVSIETEPRNHQENALLVHQRPFRESDAILVRASLMIHRASLWSLRATAPRNSHCTPTAIVEMPRSRPPRRR